MLLQFSSRPDATGRDFLPYGSSMQKNEEKINPTAKNVSDLPIILLPYICLIA
jgi:hypothetical protein